MRVKCIEHVDKFYENERAFWLEVEEIPEEFIEQAKEIDGENFSESCFGICVIQTGYNWFACIDEPGQELFYIDNNGDKHWLPYMVTEEEEQSAIAYCMDSLKEE